jgi:4-amino-4-deoxy-L-arabinose transferase-like glycosyltransferase
VRGRRPANDGDWQDRSPERSRLIPALVGLLLMLLVALPWTIYMMTKVKGLVPGWFNEVRLAQEAQFERRVGGWFSYFSIVPLMLPWTGCFVGGLWFAGAEWVEDWKRRVVPRATSERYARRLMLVWFAVPLLVMWFFPERRDRYLMPLLGPAAVLSGWSLLRYLSALERDPRTPRWPLALHWVSVTALGIGFPLVGGFWPSIRTVEGEPWLSPGIALAGATAALLLIAVCLRLRRPALVRLVGGTAVVMLLVLPQFAWGYAHSSKGRSESKPFIEAILRHYPDAIVYNATSRPRRNDLPLEMVIYLNRVPARAEHPASLLPIDRPQVIIFPDGACEPPASFLPAAPRTRIKEEWWNAYVLPARGGT